MNSELEVLLRAASYAAANVASLDTLRVNCCRVNEARLRKCCRIAPQQLPKRRSAGRRERACNRG